jgi:hypothetical protein
VWPHLQPPPQEEAEVNNEKFVSFLLFVEGRSTEAVE